ncbi:MAG: PLDc N-terminal domain-containing protein [Nevskiales bacterium]|nr:PLDc N-terminal domain-containing protein [Nevskiales bacterium]
MEFSGMGLWGFLILIADIWAIVSTLQSNISTGRKVIWIVLILFLPLLGFLLWLLVGPRGR